MRASTRTRARTRLQQAGATAMTRCYTTPRACDSTRALGLEEVSRCVYSVSTRTHLQEAGGAVKVLGLEEVLGSLGDEALTLWQRRHHSARWHAPAVRRCRREARLPTHACETPLLQSRPTRNLAWTLSRGVSYRTRGVSHRTRPQTGDTGSNLGALDEVKNEVIAPEVSHIATEVSHIATDKRRETQAATSARWMRWCARSCCACTAAAAVSAPPLASAALCVSASSIYVCI